MPIHSSTPQQPVRKWKHLNFTVHSTNDWESLQGVHEDSNWIMPPATKDWKKGSDKIGQSLCFLLFFVIVYVRV